MLSNSFELIHVKHKSFISLFEKETVSKIFIDNDIYETDHDWFGIKTQSLLAKAEEYNVEIIIIKNNHLNIKLQYSSYKTIIISNEYHTISREEKRIKIPIFLNHDIYNPTNCKKTQNVYIINSNNQYTSPSWLTLNKNIYYSFIDFKNPTRKSIKELINIIRECSLVVVHSNSKLNPYFLKYIEYISNLCQTTFIYKITLKENYSFIDEIEMLVQRSIASSLSNDATVYREKSLIFKQRHLFLQHTFINKISLKQLLEKGCISDTRPQISIISSTKRPENIKFFLSQISKQQFVEIELKLATHGFEINSKYKKYLTKRYGVNIEFISIPKTQTLGYALNRCIQITQFDIIAKMDDDDFYLENYLLDQWLALKYSSSDLVGKGAHFSFIEPENVLILREPASEYKYARLVMGATLLGNAEIFKSIPFKEVDKSEDTDFLIRASNQKKIIFQCNHYNWCMYRSSDIDNHTWKINNMKLIKNSDIIQYEFSLNPLKV